MLSARPTFAELEQSMTRSSLNAIYRLRRRAPQTIPKGPNSLALEAYSRGLAAAINQLSKEAFMSVDEIKQRFASIPGIERLTMRLEFGKEVFSLGGAFVSLDPGADDVTLEAALRSVSPAATIQTIPTIPNLGDAPVTLAPPKAPPAAGSVNPAAAHLNVKDMLASHSQAMAQIMDAQLALLQSTLNNQVNTVSTAVGSVASKIEGQTNDFKAMMAEFSNALGGENG